MVDHCLPTNLHGLECNAGKSVLAQTDFGIDCCIVLVADAFDEMLRRRVSDQEIALISWLADGVWSSIRRVSGADGRSSCFLPHITTLSFQIKTARFLAISRLLRGLSNTQ